MKRERAPALERAPAQERVPALLWSAGDPSGDRHAARVVLAIRHRRPEVRSFGLGGSAMRAAGVELLAHLDEVAVVGLSEVLGRLGAIAKVRGRLAQALAGENASREPLPRPDLFIPVDYPGMNLLLARRARAEGVAVVYFISPQLWAWGAKRMKTMQAAVRRVLVLFDFEADLYREAGVPATLVGHPLVEQVAEVPPRAAARAALGIGAESEVLVLMPGSRPGEVKTLIDPMLAIAARMRASRPGLSVWVRAAPGIEGEALRRRAAEHALPIAVAAEGDARIVRAADLALVAAGTATLETALLGTPMLILYRVSRLTYAVARRLVKLKWIGLVNVVAGRLVVPEFVQERLSVPVVAEAAAALLTDRDARAAQLAAFREVAARLGGPGAAERAAEAILSELDQVTASTSMTATIENRT